MKIEHRHRWRIAGALKSMKVVLWFCTLCGVECCAPMYSFNLVGVYYRRNGQAISFGSFQFGKVDSSAVSSIINRSRA